MIFLQFFTALILIFCCGDVFALNYQWHKKSCLQDVVASVKGISTQGLEYKVPADSFFTKHEYKNTLFNCFGIDNHFQGITYFPEKELIVISGANIHNKSASLFFITNNKTTQIKLRYDIEVEDNLWHAGGITYSDNVLILPMERFKPSYFSKIHFLQVKDIEHIVKAANSVVISDNKTGASDLIFDPLIKKNLLFAFDTNEIRIFQSKKKSIEDGFDQLRSIKTKIFKGSNMKILQQCDGKIFLANLTNTGILPPILNAKNKMTLYSYDDKKSTIHKVLDKNFDCDNYCNFRGAASMTSENNSLTLISSKMYRESQDNIIKFKIFK
jgi:hypothetical protein